MNNAMRLEAAVDMSDRRRAVVMVDDEEIDFRLAERFYKRSGLANPFVHFVDGSSFVRHLEAADDEGTPLPALVLMDINMPRMTGFEVIEQMRGSERFRDIPVVTMLTSSTDERDQERAREVGADDYLVKPFDPRAYLEFFSALAA